jgi:hypothetical protein
MPSRAASTSSSEKLPLASLTPRMCRTCLTVAGADVDAVFDDAGVAASVGHGAGGDPPGHLVLIDGHEAQVGEVARVSCLPGGRPGLAGGVTGGDSCGVDVLHVGSAAGLQGPYVDGEVGVHGPRIYAVAGSTSSASRACTRRSISSMMGRTASTGRPAGSLRSQSI